MSIKLIKYHIISSLLVLVDLVLALSNPRHVLALWIEFSQSLTHKRWCDAMEGEWQKLFWETAAISRSTIRRRRKGINKRGGALILFLNRNDNNKTINLTRSEYKSKNPLREDSYQQKDIGTTIPRSSLRHSSFSPSSVLLSLCQHRTRTVIPYN